MNEKYWGEVKKTPKKAVQKASDEKHISVHENKIYYYAGVNRDSASELNKKIGCATGCGGRVPLCARTDRDYLIIFTGEKVIFFQDL